LRKALKIYLDESGDLGLGSEKGSKYFVVAALATYSPEKLSRLVKNANRGFSRERKGAIEFSFRHESERIRKYLLEGIARSDCWIAWEAIKKERNAPVLSGDWHEIYDEMCPEGVARIIGKVSFSKSGHHGR